MAFLVTTTGTPTTVVLNDLGGRTLVHPVVSLDLELEYTSQELSNSADLQAAISGGALIAIDGNGNTITNAGEAQIPEHSELFGLLDDDHTQYHNDSRGDTRYYTKTLLDAGQLDNRYYTEAESESLVAAHANLTTNPHAVTKTQVGLGNVDNTSDADKPISTATATALGNVLTNATLRSNHIGVQPASSITEFSATQTANTVYAAPSIGNGTPSFRFLAASDIPSLLSSKISDFAATVRSTVLTGYTVGAASAIAATDTILQAFGKIQGMINSVTSAIATKQDNLVSGTNIKTINGNTVLGSGNLVVSATPASIDNATDVDTTTIPPTTGDVLRWNGTNWIPDVSMFFVNSLASNFSSRSTTRSTVTGWSVNVEAGKVYEIRVLGKYTTAAASTGITAGVLMPSGTANIAGYIEATAGQLAANTGSRISIWAINSSQATTGSSFLNLSVTGGATCSFVLDVVLTCITSGTFEFQWGSEIAGSAANLLAGSTIIVERLN